MTSVSNQIEAAIRTTKATSVQEKFDLLCNSVFSDWILNTEYATDKEFEEDLDTFYFNSLPSEYQTYACDILVSAFRTYKRGKKKAAKIILIMLNKWICEYD